MKTISKNTMIIREITSGEVRDDFAVTKGATLTVVYLVAAKTDISIKPSVHLMGTGSVATVIGIIAGKKDAMVKVSTLQHHKARQTTSNLLVKSVLSDASHCAYDGSIAVDKSAQKTDAYQRNENLLLDENTQATSSPALEILANDVRCTHGAVVKTLDHQELWYLKSRGIDEKRARTMIASGFLSSALSLIGDEKEKAMLEERVDTFYTTYG